jgi:hypothetical protein
VSGRHPPPEYSITALAVGRQAALAAAACAACRAARLRLRAGGYRARMAAARTDG